MKKLLLIALVLGICTVAKAQTDATPLSIFYENAELNANDTMHFLAFENEPEFYFAIRNNSEATIPTQCIITPINAEGAMITGICAGGECMPGNASIVFDIAAGQLYTESHALMSIESYQPSYLFKLSVMDTNHRNNPVEAYILVENGTAIQTAEAKADINLFPNPTSAQLNIAYTLPDNCTEGTLVLCNMLGSVVKTITLSNNNSHMSMSVADLPAGVYSASIMANGQRLSSSKVVVK